MHWLALMGKKQTKYRDIIKIDTPASSTLKTIPSRMKVIVEVGRNVGNQPCWVITNKIVKNYLQPWTFHKYAVDSKTRATDAFGAKYEWWRSRDWRQTIPSSWGALNSGIILEEVENLYWRPPKQSHNAMCFHLDPNPHAAFKNKKR